jgi:hypothetical protein
MISARLVVLAGLVMWMSSCGYDDRSFEGIVFACDRDHPCPEGTPCVDGSCMPMSGSGSGSARLGVACGAQQCAFGMSCCSDFIDPLYCVPLGGCKTGVGQELQCDGKEDCTGDRNCCYRSGGTLCELGDCNSIICSTTADCPGQEPFCCDFPFAEVPLKHCRPIACR